MARDDQPPASEMDFEQAGKTPSRRTVRFTLLLTATQTILTLWGDVLTDWIQKLFPEPPPAPMLMILFLLLVAALTIGEERIVIWLHGLKISRGPAVPQTKGNSTHPQKQNTGLPITSAANLPAGELPVPTGSKPAARKSDTPPVRVHPARVAFYLMRILLFNPREWRGLVDSINPHLRGNFALVDLSRKEWQSQRLRRLLLSGFVIWPLMIGLLGAVVRIFTAASGEDFQTRLVTGILGMTVGAAFSLLYGIAGSVAGGIVFGNLVALSYAVFPLMYKTSLPLEQIYLLSWLGEGIFSGIAAAVVARAARAWDRRSGPADSDSEELNQKEIPAHRADGLGRWILQGLRSVFLILLSVIGSFAAILAILAFPMVLAAVYLLMTETTLGETGAQNAFLLALIMFATVGITMGLAVWRRTGSRERGIIAGIFYGISFGSLFYLLNVPDSFQNTPTLRQITGIVYRGMIYSVSFGFSYALVRRQKDPWIAPIAASIFAEGIATIIFLRNTGDFFLRANGYSFAGFLMGLAFPVWLPVLLRPVRERVHGFRGKLKWQGRPVAGKAGQPAETEPLVAVLERVEDIAGIAALHHSYPPDALSGKHRYLFLRFFKCSEDVDAASNAASHVDRHTLLRGVEDRLVVLAEDLEPDRKRYPESLCDCLRPVAEKWLKLIDDAI